MHNFEWFFGVEAATLCNIPFSTDLKQPNPLPLYSLW